MLMTHESSVAPATLSGSDPLDNSAGIWMRLRTSEVLHLLDGAGGRCSGAGEEDFLFGTDIDDDLRGVIGTNARLGVSEPSPS